MIDYANPEWRLGERDTNQEALRTMHRELTVLIDAAIDAYRAMYADRHGEIQDNRLTLAESVAGEVLLHWVIRG